MNQLLYQQNIGDYDITGPMGLPGATGPAYTGASALQSITFSGQDPLNYYENTTQSITFFNQNNNSNQATVTVQFIRIGKNVICRIPNFTFTVTSTTSAIVSSANVIPVRFQPSAPVAYYYPCLKNNVVQSQWGWISLVNSNQFVFFTNPNQSGTWTTGTCGIGQTSDVYMAWALN